VQDKLLQQEIVKLDGSYKISAFCVVGQAYTSDENIYEAGGLRAAHILNNADSSGALTLYVSGSSVSAAGAALSITLKSDALDANSGTFKLESHYSETINAVGASNSAFHFAAASSSGQSPWQDILMALSKATPGRMWLSSAPRHLAPPTEQTRGTAF
jgi:hypothetical protein